MTTLVLSSATAPGRVEVPYVTGRLHAAAHASGLNDPSQELVTCADACPCLQALGAVRNGRFASPTVTNETQAYEKDPARKNDPASAASAGASAVVRFDVAPGTASHIVCMGVASSSKPIFLGASSLVDLPNSRAHPDLRLRLRAVDKHDVPCASSIARSFVAQEWENGSHTHLLEWGVEVPEGVQALRQVILCHCVLRRQRWRGIGEAVRQECMVWSCCMHEGECLWRHQHVQRSASLPAKRQ